MATGRKALAALGAIMVMGCVAPTAERAPSAEPERTYVGRHDERPLPTVAFAKAPATNCPGGSSGASLAGAELASLPVLSRTLFYLREDYPRDIAPQSRELLLASLSAVAAADREVAVERDPGTPPRWVTVTVKGEHCTLNIERVDTPSSLRSSLQEGMRFIGSHLQVAGGDAEAQLIRMEIAATNGMLSALDAGSVVMDLETYRDLRGKWPGLWARASAASPERGDENLASAGTAVPVEGEVAYLRPGAFRKGAAAQVAEALAGAGGHPPKGIILDLRDNSGGLLDEAAAVADHFIQRGVLGWTVGKHERKALEAHDSGRDFSGAVVVLVNHDTKEAAELVASAIKNLGRGVVLGEPTGGVGSVRALFELTGTEHPAPASTFSDDGAAQDAAEVGESAPAPDDQAMADTTGVDRRASPMGLLLRTGYLRTANDDAIEGAGVRPDLPLPRPAGQASSDDCLSRLARAIIDQAADSQRSTLLATTKALANKQACGRAP
jgi:hypothetical protein